MPGDKIEAATAAGLPRRRDDAAGRVDACVHPMPVTSHEIRDYMPKPWSTFPLPSIHRYILPAPTGRPPFGEWSGRRSQPGTSAHVGPDDVRRFLAGSGADVAVLLPLTRGLLANVSLGNEVCAATNRWTSERWTGAGTGVDLRGSIRVNPGDPDGAVRELERWADDPTMVQVAVPLEAHQPYGHRAYRRIWEAAAAHHLPVAIYPDCGMGTDFYPTATGYPRLFEEFAVLNPLNFVFHLTSFIAEGVFAALPDLRIVFPAGGHDVLVPLMWRMDIDWPSSRTEAPWVTELPSRYLARHVRFCTNRLEGPGDIGADGEAWNRLSRAADFLLFASNFPHWSGGGTAEQIGGHVAAAERERITSGNAFDFYARLGHR
jgi:predicted TIM-barrel fold metal-dependent hydrolase